MRTVALTALVALAATPASALIRDSNAPPTNPNHPVREQHKRSITSSADALDGKIFDYVIAGGGLAGLAIAGRLAESKNVTVAVIEAGGDGSDVLQQVQVPGYSYGKGLTGDGKDETDWQYKTTPQVSPGEWRPSVVVQMLTARGTRTTSQSHGLEARCWAVPELSTACFGVVLLLTSTTRGQS